MTRSERENQTTITRCDLDEIEEENVPEIASTMLALLEIALLNNKNRTWLDHYRQKNEKKLASGAISH